MKASAVLGRLEGAELSTEMDGELECSLAFKDSSPALRGAAGLVFPLCACCC